MTIVNGKATIKFEGADNLTLAMVKRGMIYTSKKIITEVFKSDNSINEIVLETYLPNSKTTGMRILITRTKAEQIPWEMPAKDLANMFDEIWIAYRLNPSEW